jgi:hypothetical protein
MMKVFLYETLYLKLCIIIFIMYDIKYFFSINVIKQSKRGKKILRRTNYQKYYLKVLFFKI